MSVFMTRKSASRGFARLYTSRVGFYDSAETNSILLSLQRAQLEIALFSYISDRLYNWTVSSNKLCI